VLLEHLCLYGGQREIWLEIVQDLARFCLNSSFIGIYWLSYFVGQRISLLSCIGPTGYLRRWNLVLRGAMLKGSIGGKTLNQLAVGG